MAVLPLSGKVEEGDGCALPLRRSTTFTREMREVAPGSEVRTTDGTTYTVMNLLGHGTFAKVYKCVAQDTQVAYAVKVVSLTRMKFSPDFEAQEQMITREVEILKKLRHERICNMHDFLRTEENWFLIMELVCHGELFHNITPNKGMKELEAKYVFQQLIEGIGYIHSKGVIHRDLKPENILIVRSQPGPALEGQTVRFHDIKIADFGLSKVREGENLMANSCVGSPVYAAPEIFSEHGYGQTVDTWSLGAILFVMLCGQYPFDGRTMPRDRTLGTVAQVSGCVSGAGCEAITLSCRDGEERRYSNSDAEEQGPWRLQREERLLAVMQEPARLRSDGRLGLSVALFTSMGQVIALDGPKAPVRARFVAAAGSQITGLEFDGSRLVGVRTAKAGRGAVASVRGWCGSAVDGVEVSLRDGTAEHYGGDGGFPKGPWRLEDREMIFAVVQEQTDRYLSKSLVLLTSLGNVIALEGSDAAPAAVFAAPSDRQLDRLRFDADGRLVGAQQTPEDCTISCANFRMDSARWSELSQDAQDMVCGLLCVNVDKRWTLPACWRKSWLRDRWLPYQEDDDFDAFVKIGSKNDLVNKAAKAAQEPDESESVSEGDTPSATGTPASSSPASPMGLEGQMAMTPTHAEQRAAEGFGGGGVALGGDAGRREHEAVDAVFFPRPRRGQDESPIFGSVQVIRARLDSAVDRVEFQMWKGHTLCYGGHGGGSVCPWKLKPTEYITAVEQERPRGDFGYLGNELAFYTSSGRVHTVTGKLARKVHRFSAKRGCEISGLNFDGSRLIGVQMQPVQDGRGVVAGVSARLADCLDQVQIHLRGGKRVVYGTEGGRPQSLVQMRDEEYIIGVAQEDHDRYLGMGIAFFTSVGGVIAFDGTRSASRGRFAAPNGQQIFGLHFEGSRLVDVLARAHSARPRGASKEPVV